MKKLNGFNVLGYSVFATCVMYRTYFCNLLADHGGDVAAVAVAASTSEKVVNQHLLMLGLDPMIFVNMQPA